jgi:uncharacterized protein (DUF1800 family)
MNAPQRLVVLSFFAAVGLAGCGGNSDTAITPRLEFATSSGQVNLLGTSPDDVSAYAAARLLEQASWGPTPSAVQEVQRLGMEGWIDRQLSLPASILNAPQYVIDHDNNNEAERDLAHSWVNRAVLDLAMSGPDQLRQRVNWALFSYIPINAGQPYAASTYFNTLQNNAFGSYRDLLKAISLHSGMGFFLNNDQNTTDEPNENFARELMQLFSVGLVILNSDGTVRRDASGKALETYTQNDVKEATRALSGWQNDWQENLPKSNFGNFNKPMVARTWPENAHDKGQKRLLGKVIPSSQTLQKDLDQVLDILVEHPNTAPFVATRLIQYLVASDPSPAFVERVANAFVSSKGDLKKTVKALLLDPEARAGDTPGTTSARIGRIKDPLLYTTSYFRALGCRASVLKSEGNSNSTLGRAWRDPPSVFGWASPFHRAPESLVLAPEQKLLRKDQIGERNNFVWEISVNKVQFDQAGCELSLFEEAAAQSDESLIVLVNTRFFKGVMPAPIQHGARQLLSTELASKAPLEKVSSLLQPLLLTPSFGVVK